MESRCPVNCRGVQLSTHPGQHRIPHLETCCTPKQHFAAAVFMAAGLGLEMSLKAGPGSISPIATAVLSRISAVLSIRWFLCASINHMPWGSLLPIFHCHFSRISAVHTPASFPLLPPTKRLCLEWATVEQSKLGKVPLTCARIIEGQLKRIGLLFHFCACDF